MSLTRLKFLMQEGTDDEIAQYLRGLGLANGAPLIGEVIYWPHVSLPHSLFDSLKGMVFLKCNGQSFDGNTYPELAKVLPLKVLPELRGEFIRCWDDGKGTDPGRQIATWQTGSALVQETVRDIDAVTAFSCESRDRLGWDIPSYDPGLRARSIGGKSTISPAGDWTASGSYVGWSRPRNVALQALIRAK